MYLSRIRGGQAPSASRSKQPSNSLLAVGRHGLPDKDPHTVGGGQPRRKKHQKHKKVQESQKKNREGRAVNERETHGILQTWATEGRKSGFFWRSTEINPPSCGLCACSDRSFGGGSRRIESACQAMRAASFVSTNLEQKKV